MAANSTVIPDLSKIPALAPPPGVVPDFINTPGSLKPAVYATAAVCITVTVLGISIRLYTKGRIMKSLGIEDCKQHPLSKELKLIHRVDACLLSGVRFYKLFFLRLTHE